MTIVHQTKSEFIAQTREKYGFGKRKSGQPIIPHKTDYAKPEISIHEKTHERFADQGRAAVLALADSKEAR